MFKARKEAVEAEIKSLQETLSLLEFKCWYYSKAMEDGTEEYLQAMLPDKLPSDIQKLYDASHNDKRSRYSAPKLFKTSWLVLILID